MDKNLFQVNVSAVVLNNNKVLLIKRSMNEDVFPGLYGIPGGKLDNTDEGLFEGLEREIMEEVGILVMGEEIISTETVVKPEKNVIYIRCKSSYVSGTAIPKEDTESVMWVGKDELPPKEMFTPNTYELIQKSFPLVGGVSPKI